MSLPPGLGLGGAVRLVLVFTIFIIFIFPAFAGSGRAFERRYLWLILLIKGRKSLIEASGRGYCSNGHLLRRQIDLVRIFKYLFVSIYIKLSLTDVGANVHRKLQRPQG